MHPSATMSTMNSETPTNGAAGTSTFDRRSDLRSPMTLSGNLGASTLSMRQKAARRRRINAQHNSNFRAGYVPVTEDALHRTGIRGRKRYFLYCVVGTLMVVTFLNIAMTGYLLYILGMTHNGLSSVELVSLGGRDFLRVFPEAHVSTLSLNGAPVGARLNSPIEVRTEEAALEVKANSGRSRSSLKLEGTNLTLTTKDFCVKTKGSNRSVSADLQCLAQANSIENLFAETVTVRKIQGVGDFRDNDLYIENTRNDTTFAGYKEVCMETLKDVNIKARSTLLEAESINFNVNNLHLGPQVPIVDARNIGQKVIRGYKLCVCADSGRLFAVKSKFSCRVGAPICGSEAS